MPKPRQKKPTPKKPAPLKRKKATAKKPAPKKAKQKAKQRAASIAKPVNGVWPTNEPYDRAATILHANPIEAVKLFKAALKLQPERPRIHMNMGWALSKYGQHAEAKAAIQRAHELDPRDPYIAARRVQVLFELHDNAALEAARHAMQLPDLPPDDRHYVHAAICWTLMRTAPAAGLRETEKHVADWPDDPEAFAALGCALAAVCRWDEGVPWLDKAIAAAPDDARFPTRRAQIIEARDVATALMTKLRDQAERHPDDAKHWRELGLGLAKFARLPEALEAFERAHELAPVDHGAKKHEPLVVAALMVEATARSHLVIGDIAPIG